MTLQEAIEAGKLTEGEVDACQWDEQGYGRLQEQFNNAISQAAHAKLTSHLAWGIRASIDQWLADHHGYEDNCEGECVTTRNICAKQIQDYIASILQSLNIEKPEETT